MAHCVNKSSTEFKELLAQTTMHPDELAARVSIWQEANGLDNFPTYKEIRPTVDQEFLEALYGNEMQMDVNVDDIITSEESTIADENIDNTTDIYEEAVEEGTDKKMSISNQVKLTAMQKSMPGVIFIEDDTLDASGVLLGKGSPEYKEYGVPVIKVNPNLLFDDTIVHEYGHLYIDLLGGMSNSRVKAAYKQLENSGLAKQVIEENPELSGELLQKEIVATAIGKEGSEIFNAEGDINWWDRFVNWFFNLISLKTGVSENMARELAKDLIYNRVTQDELIGSLDEANQFLKYQRRNKAKEEYIPNKKLETLAEFNEKARDKINLKLQIYKKKLVKDKKTSQSEMLEELLSDLQNHSENTEIEKAARFIDYASTIINSKRLKKFTTGEFITEELPKVLNEYIETGSKEAEQTIAEAKEFLNTLDSFLASFDLLNDLNNFLDTKNGEAYLEDLNKLIPNLERTLNNIIASKDSILKSRVNISREILAFELGSKSSYAQADYTTQLEQEWNKLHPKGFKGYTKEEKQERQKYINQKVREAMPELIKANVDMMREKLILDTDIWAMSAYLVSADNLSSSTIQLAKKMFDEADFNARVASLETYNDEIANVAEEFNKQRPGSNTLEKFKNILEFDENNKPTGFLAGKYKSGFYKIYSEALGIRNEGLYNLFNNNSGAREEYNAYQKLVEQANNIKEDLNYDPKILAGLYRQIASAKEQFYSKWKGVDKEFKKSQDQYEAFKKENTIRKEVVIDGKKEVKYEPNKKWVNNKFNYDSLSAIEKKAYDTILNRLREDDKKLPFQSRLVKRAYNDIYFAELPTASKSNLERITTEGLTAAVKESMDILKIRPEDTELSESRQEFAEDPHTAHKLILGNEKEEAKLGLPVHYRGKKDSDQSYDLFTLIALNNAMSNNYAEKKKIQDSMELLLDVLADDNSKVMRVGSGLTELFKTTKKYSTESRAMSNEYKALKSMIETRLYGLGMDDSKYNKLSSYLMKWSASTTFALNYFAGAANLAQGAAQNLIEAVGGKNVNYAAGNSRYFNDMGAWTSDIGKHKKVSLTNHLLGRLNILESFHGVHSKFINDTRLKNLLGPGSTYFMSNAGEHYIHSTMMYGIMDNIKVTNAAGEYLNDKGEVVKDAKDAMTIADAYYVENGSVKMKPVEYTTMSFNKFSEVELSNYIKHIGSQLHGQYDSNLKAMIQKHWAGSQAYMFRKWLIPGVLRRFRGIENITISEDKMKNAEYDMEFFSEDLQNFEEGYYYTTLRYALNVIKGAKDKTQTAAMVWNSLSDQQRKNVHKTFIDAIIMAGMYVSYMVLKGLGADADDDDPTKRFVLFGAFVARRLYAEQAFYRSPMEFYKLMRSPAAALTHTENIFKLFNQVMPGYDMDDRGLYWKALDEYSTGRRKGESVLKYKVFKVSPFISQAVRSTEEALTYIE